MGENKKPNADDVSAALETLVDAGWDLSVGRAIPALGAARISVWSPDIPVGAPSADELVAGLMKLHPTEGHGPTEGGTDGGV